MFCKECGTENNNKNRVCTKCGVELNSSKKVLWISSLFVILAIIIISIPMITSYFIDKKIKEKSSNLKEIGLQLEVVRSNGYFITNKEVNVKINNGRYFSNYILDKFIESSETDTKVLIETLKTVNIDWETLLNGTTFKGNLVTNNYMLDNPKLDISLDKLSHDIMYEIQNDKKAAGIVIPLLDKKILNALIEFDKKGIFKKIKIGDIDETIVDGKDRLILQLLDNNFQNNTLDINRIYLSLKDNKKVSVLQLDKLRSKYDDIDHHKFNIENLSFSSSEFKFSAKNLKTEQYYKNKGAIINIFSSFSLEDILVNTKNLPVSISKINYNVNLDEILRQEFNTILEDYKNKSTDLDKYGEYELNNLLKLFNSGFTLKSNINVENLKVKDINSGYYSFNTNIRIKKNNLNLSSIDIDNLLQTVESEEDDAYGFLKLSIDEGSSKLIMKSNKEFKNIFEKIGYLKDEKYNFDFWREDGKIVLNGLDLGVVAYVLGNNHFDNKNYDSAIDFYKYAIDNNNLDAYFRLAYSYNEVKKYDLAIDNYKKYIEQTNSTKENQSLAMNNLARVYSYGKEDPINTIKWAKKAVENGYKDYFLIAYNYDILKDYKNAEIYYLKSIDENEEKVSMWNLGLIYEYGKGKINKNNKKAFDLYLKAARLNYKDAYSKVSYMYQYGIGTKKDLQKSRIWKNRLKNGSSKLNIDKEIKSKVIKKQFNQNGLFLEIEYPEYIVPKTYVDFKISVINNNSFASSKGGVSISFPQFSNLNIINNTSSLDTKSYPSNSKLWNGNIKKNIKSEYFMFEGWTNKWKKDQKKTMDFSVYIDDYSDLENINIFIRSILINNKIEYVNPTYGDLGQQGYRNINISIPLSK
ncbi:MAG: hypothetical protein CL624_04530 [Arcobacter sp.]|nr:hypothetical protein [Arcobacter sp.]|tara:strand:- start:16731 stop:19319 length:2589 start_codon:yes stop_codon:yes gene_type:complete